MPRPQGFQITYSVLILAAAFVDEPGKKRAGYELSRTCNVKLDTVYDALVRMEGEGWLVSERERLRTAGRAPRRLYLITAKGQAKARESLAPLQMAR